jgi:allophanate hydrolase subunit 2
MIAQMKAGDKIQFKFTDHQTAEGLNIKTTTTLDAIRNCL